MGQAPGEIKCAEARSGILGREFFPTAGVADAIEAAPEGTERNRLVALAAPDDRALQAHLNIRRRFERYFFRMHPGAHRVVVPLKRSGKEVVAYGTSDARDVGNEKWLDPVDAKAPDVFRVVAPGHAAADPRPVPVVHFPKGNFVADDMGRNVTFKDREVVDCGNWPQGDGSVAGQRNRGER